MCFEGDEFSLLHVPNVFLDIWIVFELLKNRLWAGCIYDHGRTFERSFASVRNVLVEKWPFSVMRMIKFEELEGAYRPRKRSFRYGDAQSWGNASVVFAVDDPATFLSAAISRVIPIERYTTPGLSGKMTIHSDLLLMYVENARTDEAGIRRRLDPGNWRRDMLRNVKKGI